METSVSIVSAGFVVHSHASMVFLGPIQNIIIWISEKGWNDAKAISDNHIDIGGN